MRVRPKKRVNGSRPNRGAPVFPSPGPATSLATCMCLAWTRSLLLLLLLLPEEHFHPKQATKEGRNSLIDRRSTCLSAGHDKRKYPSGRRTSCIEKEKPRLILLPSVSENKGLIFCMPTAQDRLACMHARQHLIILLV